MSTKIKKESVEETEKIETVDKTEEEKMKALSPEQKKTIWEWVKYLGTVLLTAILNKLTGKC